MRAIQSIILSQDATMQHRMEAGLRKYVDDTVQIINYAVYSAKVVEKDNGLAYVKYHGFLMMKMDMDPKEKILSHM